MKLRPSRLVRRRVRFLSAVSQGSGGKGGKLRCHGNLKTTDGPPASGQAGEGPVVPAGLDGEPLRLGADVLQVGRTTKSRIKVEADVTEAKHAGTGFPAAHRAVLIQAVGERRAVCWLRGAVILAGCGGTLSLLTAHLSHFGSVSVHLHGLVSSSGAGRSARSSPRRRANTPNLC